MMLSCGEITTIRNQIIDGQIRLSRSKSSISFMRTFQDFFCHIFSLPNLLFFNKIKSRFDRYIFFIFRWSTNVMTMMKKLFYQYWLNLTRSRVQVAAKPSHYLLEKKLLSQFQKQKVSLSGQNVSLEPLV